MESHRAEIALQFVSENALGEKTSIELLSGFVSAIEDDDYVFQNACPWQSCPFRGLHIV